VEHVACIGEMRNAYQILVGNPERKRPFGIHRHIWKIILKMDLQQIRCECVDWTQLRIGFL
jgi:hypothetical protein